MSLTAGRVAVASMRWLIFTSCTSMNSARMDSAMGTTAASYTVVVRVYIPAPNKLSKGCVSRDSTPMLLMMKL